MKAQPDSDAEETSSRQFPSWARALAWLFMIGQAVFIFIAFIGLGWVPVSGSEPKCYVQELPRYDRWRVDVVVTSCGNFTARDEVRRDLRTGTAYELTTRGLRLPWGQRFPAITKAVELPPDPR